MKISATMSMWMCIAFGILSYGVAVTGFMGLQTLTDPTDRDAALGYAWFWTFLGAVATVFGILSWMIRNGKLGPVE